MEIKFNGKTISISNELTTLGIFLKSQNIQSQGIALALNQKVVHKENWNKIQLKEKDEILLVTATQGG